MAGSGPLLIIACGGVAGELARIRRINGWRHMDLQCLPAHLHNRPERITAAVERLIESARDRYQRIFVAYGDCGTGGALDTMLRKHGVQRLPGAHCYEFLCGSEAFERLAAEEPGSFYLTDFLVSHFGRLVIGTLGLDRHPGLLPQYFGNYRRVVHLAQANSPRLRSMARAHATRLGLAFEYRLIGDKPLTCEISRHAEGLRS